MAKHLLDGKPCEITFDEGSYYLPMLEIENMRRDNMARSTRSALLAETDWLVIKAQETGVAMDQAWVEYRQALRDITVHVNFPYLQEADWPAKPE
jgi:type II secretory pathway component PulL